MLIRSAVPLLLNRLIVRLSCLALPERLVELVHRDAALILHDKQLVPLPRAPSVSTILDSFRTSVLDGPEGISASVVNETTAGLKRLFTESLGLRLLYSFERLQVLGGLFSVAFFDTLRSLSQSLSS
eukprot:m.280111 g.280111  ORF g.280111 m.280111 type:complete len:127 (-) comp54915_c0_seq5:23-403(-)